MVVRGHVHRHRDDGVAVAKIEFYDGDAAGHMCVLDDGAVPRVGDLISIRKVTWRVVRVTWAVDHADVVMGAKLRANV